MTETNSSVAASPETRPSTRTVPETVYIVLVLLAAFCLCATFYVVAPIPMQSRQDREAAMQLRLDSEAALVETAFRDVRGQRVAVNGPKGTEEWRGYYAKGLERFLNGYNFNHSCSFNGFLRDTAASDNVDCIAIGNARVVRTRDGEIRYFSERFLPAEIVELDIMQQDVHASDYLDIDGLTGSIQKRAYGSKAAPSDGSKGATSK